MANVGSIDADSEVYWRRSGVFWRLRATLVWLVRKLLPCARRSSGTPALGPRARDQRGAPVPKQHQLHPPVLGLCLSLHWMQPSLFFHVSLFFLFVRVEQRVALREQRNPPTRKRGQGGGGHGSPRLS